MTRRETLAYLAGLVDGEAYIGIKRNRPKNCVSLAYHERIQVRMVDESAIKFLTTTLGGKYYRERPRSDAGRPLYCWQVSDARAASILKQLLPYLKVKRRNAETVLLLRVSKTDPRALRRGSPARRTMSPVVLAERERLYVPLQGAQPLRR